MGPRFTKSHPRTNTFNLDTSLNKIIYDKSIMRLYLILGLLCCDIYICIITIYIFYTVKGVQMILMYQLTRMIPVLAAAYWVINHSTVFGPHMPTRSPFLMPSVNKLAAN